jgi:hypothetical protein
MHKGLFWFLAVAMLFLTDCATGDTKVVKQTQTSLGRFRVVEVPDLEGTGPDPPWPAPPTVPMKVRREIADAVARQLKESGLFVEVERNEGRAVQSVLLLRGEVVDYDPGSRAGRYMTPFGSGKGRIEVRVRFLEKDSGSEVAEANFEGTVRAGLLGGSSTETYGQIAQEIVQFIEKNFQQRLGD